MNTYVALFEHTADKCPATTKANMERTMSSMSQIESLAKELGIQLDAIHVLLPGHRGVAVLQAEDYETAGEFLQQLGLQDWNDDLTLYRSYAPQEALAKGAERLAGG